MKQNIKANEISCNFQRGGIVKLREIASKILNYGANYRFLTSLATKDMSYSS